MNDNDLDRMLMKRDDILPSSGFVASVMEAVRQEAAAPAPISFPWKWALPGFIVCVAMAMGMIVQWFHSGAQASRAAKSIATALPMESITASLPQMHIAISTLDALEWSALALLVSFVAAWFSMRIASTKN